MKKYFVSFNYSFNQDGMAQHGFGNTTVERLKPFTNAEEFNELGNHIAKQANYPKDSVVIINYQLLEV